MSLLGGIQRYYSDGETKISDPLWIFTCRRCGCKTWSTSNHEYICKECGSDEIEKEKPETLQ